MRRSAAAPFICLAIVLALAIAPVAAYAEDDGSDTDATGSTPLTPVSAPVAATPNPAPVIVVRSYTTSAQRLVIGSAFDLSVSVYNATSRRADNVVVSLGAASATATGANTNALTVLGTGNAKFLGALKGQSEAAVTFGVIAGPSTTPGALSVPVTVSFEHQGLRQEVTYYIGLLLERDAALSLVTAQLPESAVVGETFDASFEVANASAFALSGVTLSVEASGAQVTDESIFLGSFDAAGSEGIDVTITPKNAGPLDVSVVVTYRDDYGRVQTFKQTRQVRVETAPEIAPEEQGAAEQVKADNWFVKLIKSIFGLG